MRKKDSGKKCGRIEKSNRKSRVTTRRCYYRGPPTPEIHKSKYFLSMRSNSVKEYNLSSEIYELEDRLMALRRQSDFDGEWFRSLLKDPYSSSREEENNKLSLAEGSHYTTSSKIPIRDSSNCINAAVKYHETYNANFGQTRLSESRCSSRTDLNENATYSHKVIDEYTRGPISHGKKETWCHRTHHSQVSKPSSPIAFDYHFPSSAPECETNMSYGNGYNAKDYVFSLKGEPKQSKCSHVNTPNSICVSTENVCSNTLDTPVRAFDITSHSYKVLHKKNQFGNKRTRKTKSSTPVLPVIVTNTHNRNNIDIENKRGQSTAKLLEPGHTKEPLLNSKFNSSNLNVNNETVECTDTLISNKLSKVLDSEDVRGTRDNNVYTTLSISPELMQPHKNLKISSRNDTDDTSDIVDKEKHRKQIPKKSIQNKSPRKVKPVTKCYPISFFSAKLKQSKVCSTYRKKIIYPSVNIEGQTGGGEISNNERVQSALKALRSRIAYYKKHPKITQSEYNILIVFFDVGDENDNLNNYSDEFFSTFKLSSSSVENSIWGTSRTNSNSTRKITDVVINCITPPVSKHSSEGVCSSTDNRQSLYSQISKYESLILSVHAAFEGEYKRKQVELEARIRKLKGEFTLWKSNLARKKHAILSEAVAQRDILKVELEKNAEVETSHCKLDSKPNLGVSDNDSI